MCDKPDVKYNFKTDKCFKTETELLKREAITTMLNQGIDKIVEGIQQKAKWCDKCPDKLECYALYVMKGELDIRVIVMLETQNRVQMMAPYVFQEIYEKNKVDAEFMNDMALRQQLKGNSKIITPGQFKGPKKLN